MADTVHDPGLDAQDLRTHRETFHSFGKVLLFAILCIGLILACLALAFLGNIPLLSLLIGVAGMMALVVAFAVAT